MCFHVCGWFKLAWFCSMRHCPFCYMYSDWKGEISGVSVDTVTLGICQWQNTVQESPSILRGPKILSRRICPSPGQTTALYCWILGDREHQQHHSISQMKRSTVPSHMI
jgi:hypothetical protein